MREFYTTRRDSWVQIKSLFRPSNSSIFYADVSKDKVNFPVTVDLTKCVVKCGEEEAGNYC